MNLKQIPNLLSAFRLMLVPLFIYLFFLDYPDNKYAALFVFLFAGATDILDGYLARRNGWITNLGKLLDPLADKLMQLTVLVCLGMKELIPLWMPLIYAAKELFMMFGALLVLKKIKFTVMAHWYGKASTAIIYTIIFLVIVMPNLSMPAKAALCGLALTIAIFAMIMYVKDTLRINRRIKQQCSGD